MKKILMVFSLLFLMNVSNKMYSQTSDKTTNYIYAEGSVKFAATGKHKETDINFGSKYTVEVNDKEEIIKKVKEFESGVDLMNYMSEKGWECFNTQIILSTYVTFYTYNFRKLKKE
ncbi:hypothetical protein [Xanthomarina sp. F2636L]|uniref:hypothetical protein n=1 Tax=Xanthomarina sp. F2636L TaxID=2996018 RepID=UPI00225E6068|nr:hypothetical protein [Xanthomarina sp. F2636L]MCX7550287.1 hypothetical protein [Xanthomarina sp. F2636L]